MSDDKLDNKEDVPAKKAIKIKDFIVEDRDIEKASYISESSTEYVSEIAEGEEPENLLNFAKIQEEEISNDTVDNNEDLQKAIDEELKSL